jgi:uncharacterized protein
MGNPLLAVLDQWSRRYVWRHAPQEVPQTLPATVVTGASEGIGLAIARRFAEGGDRVVLIGRRAPELSAAADAIKREFGIDAVALAIDINDRDSGQRIEAALRDRGLHADIFVNNAGFGLSGPFTAEPEHDIDALVSCNVAALTRLSRYFLPGMLSRRRGGLINVGSLAGFTPGPYQAAYYASKAYVLSLTRAIAYETRGRGVRVMLVAPGPIETTFHARMNAESAYYRLLPAPTPQAVAAATYAGYRWHRRIVTPGLFATALSLFVRITPSRLAMPVTALLLYPWGATRKPPRDPE